MRRVLFASWMILSVLVLGLMFLPFLLLPVRCIHWGIRLWSAGVVWALRVIVGVTIEVRGLDRLSDHPTLIAAKHFCMLDTVAPFVFLPRTPAFVLKRELLSIPIYGWHARKAQLIPIDRGGGAKTLRAMRQTAHLRLEQGRDVIIFPEGTRKTPGDAPDYKTGVYGLYQALGVGCQPMALSTGTVWPAKGLPNHPGHVVFEILPEIPAGLSRAEFMTRLEADLEGATNRLLAETPSKR